MGGEGHMLEMNKRLEQNRALRNSQQPKTKSGKYSNNHKIVFKEFSEEVIAKVIEENKRQRKLQWQKEMLIIIVIGLILGLAFYLYL